MNAVKELDLDLIESQILKDNASLQNDQSQSNVAAIALRTEERAKLFTTGHTKGQQYDIERVKVFKDNQSLQSSLKNYMVEDFSADSTLSPKAFEDYNRVLKMVKNTKNDLASEEESRLAISSLYLRSDKSGIKYISKDHPVMGHLWTTYYNVTTMNYLKYFSSELNRNEKRDEILKNKIVQNRDKLIAATFQSCVDAGFFKS